METRTLEFETPQFLHSLFAHDEALLREMEAEQQIKLTTRDGWMRIEGEPAAVAGAESTFSALERARRSGGEITPHAFRIAVESGKPPSGDARAPERATDVAELLSRKLLGSAKRPPVVPKTLGQLAYLKAMDANPVVFGVGPAGTGKTYLAMARALAALKAREVNRVILARPAVEAGEALGFLPGDLQEKIAPYLRPLYDAIYDMLEPAEVERYIEANMIEIAPLAYMRGRTLNRAFVILDEAQNTTEEQMLMFLTRLGEGARCVITGDPSQIDLRPRSRSGLREAMDILRETEGVAFAEFDRSDVVRHPVVQRIIEAYEKARSRRGGGWEEG
ncbi:PhoH family protein [soil metagenome]